MWFRLGTELRFTRTILITVIKIESAELLQAYQTANQVNINATLTSLVLLWLLDKMLNETNSLLGNVNLKYRLQTHFCTELEFTL